MTIPLRKSLAIIRGSTFALVTRWETLPVVYKAITAITNTAPVRITSASHGLVGGWRAWILSAGGITEINAVKNPPVKEAQSHKVTVVDPNTVDFNDLDSSAYAAYISGGYLAYNTPADLASHTSRMQIKDKVGGAVLISLTTDVAGGIVLDNATKTITITISAAVTAAITAKKGVYDLELVNTVTGTVSKLLTGTVAFVDEVTT